jgi:hypothetical protein
MLNLVGLFRIADRLVPVMLHNYLLGFHVPCDSAESTFAVLIPFWCESFEHVSELLQINIR